MSPRDAELAADDQRAGIGDHTALAQRVARGPESRAVVPRWFLSDRVAAEDLLDEALGVAAVGDIGEERRWEPTEPQLGGELAEGSCLRLELRSELLDEGGQVVAFRLIGVGGQLDPL